MTWFKLDDKATFHTKVLAAGNAAWGALCRMGTYASEHGTDGLIPFNIAQMIASRAELTKLVSVVLLEPVDGGYAIHDFLDYNPSRAEVEAGRSARREHAQKGAAARWGNAPSMPRASGEHRPSIDVVHAPVPTRPDPTREEETEDRRSAPPPAPPTGASLGGKPKGETGETKAQITEVFEHWVAARAKVLGTKAGSPPKLSPKRKAKVLARLRDGYSVADLKQAVDGMLGTEFNVTNGHTDLELVCRDAEHVDRYRQGPSSTPVGPLAIRCHRAGDDNSPSGHVMRHPSRRLLQSPEWEGAWRSDGTPVNQPRLGGDIDACDLDIGPPPEDDASANAGAGSPEPLGALPTGT